MDQNISNVEKVHLDTNTRIKMDGFGVTTFVLFCCLVLSHGDTTSKDDVKISKNELGEFVTTFLKRCQWSKTVLLTNGDFGRIIRQFSMRLMPVAALDIKTNISTLFRFNSVVVMTLENQRTALRVVSEVLARPHFVPQNWLLIMNTDLIDTDLPFIPHDYNIILATAKPNNITFARVYTGEGEVLKSLPIGYWQVEEKLLHVRFAPVALPILSNNVVRVTTVSFPPHYAPHLLHPKGDKESCGIYGEILQILKKKINFTYTITVPEDGNFGNIMNNSHYSGMVGLLINNESDISIAMSMTTDRSSVIDYSHTVTKSTVDFVYRNREAQRWRLFFFCEPFSNWLWMSIIGILLIVAVLFYVTKKFISTQHYQQDDSSNDSKHNTQFTNFLWSVQVSYFTLLGKCYYLCLPGSTAKIVLQVFHLFSLVIFVQYSCVLTSLLTVTNKPVPFRSLAELVEKSDYHVGTLSGTSIVEVYKFSADGVKAKVWQRMKKNSRLYLTKNISDGLDLAYTDNYAFLMERTVLASLMRGNCSLQFGEKSAYHVLSAFGYRKEFRYRKIFDKYLRLIIESGVVKKIEEKYTPPDHNKACELKGWQMGLERYSVVGLFLLMIFAVIASLFALLVEKVVFHFYF